MLERREDTYRTAVAFVTHTRDYQSAEILAALTRHGFAAADHPYSAAAQQLIKTLDPDLVLLAVDPIIRADLELIRQTAAKTSSAIVVLIPGPSSEGLMEALDAGADVCLRDTDPVEVLSAQLSALFRRRMPVSDGRAIDQPDTLRLDDLSLDFDRGLAVRGDTPIALTAEEFKVLALLARNATRAVSPVELARALRGGDISGRETEEIVRNHIRRLRRKLDARPGDPAYIVSVRGFGYMLDCRIQKSGSESGRRGLFSVA